MALLTNVVNVVINGPFSVTSRHDHLIFSGSFTGNGAGLTNRCW